MHRPLLSTLAAALLLASPARAGWAPAAGTSFPIDVQDLDGQRLRDADLRGKIVVIDFWASWCGPCRQEFPDLGAYYQRLQGQDQVVFLSFNVDDDPAARDAFLKALKPPFPVYDATKVRYVFGATALPTKLVVDLRKGVPGQMRFRAVGVTSSRSIESRVASLLGRKARPRP